jgi:two-component system, sensor histidine kinase
VLLLLEADTPELPVQDVADACLAQPLQRCALLSTIELLRRAPVREHAAVKPVEARDKDTFLAMLAHELRNPLNAIVAANHLQDGAQASTGERARLGAVIERQSRHMSQLLDQLLDASRITRGEIALQLAPSDLGALVSRVAESQRAVLEERGQKLTLTLPAHPVLTACDELRLEQALANLLANASKYSSRGTSVQLEMHVEPRSAGRAVISLSDHGVGIAPEMLGAVFDMFVQADRTLDRGSGGLGLGLTVARQLIEQHGGQVRAESAGLGHGARFIVTLPLVEPRPTLVRAPQNTQVAVAPESADSTLSLDVLVIEDNDDTRELMCSILETRGHHVVSACDGLEGLERAAEHQPAVALIDIGLPGMNGYAVAQHLRNAEHGLHPYLIALTGYGSPSDRERSLAAGFDMHVVKPLDTAALFALLQQVAHGRGRSQAAV